MFHQVVSEALLDFFDIGGLEPLGPSDYIERYGLAFCKGFEALTLNGGEMHEYIFTVVLLDETETLGVVEPLHFALCHFPFLLCCLRSVAGTTLIAAVAGVLRQENHVQGVSNTEEASETYCNLLCH